MYDLSQLKGMLLIELREVAKEMGLKNSTGLKKDALIDKIFHSQSIDEEEEEDAKPKRKRIKRTVKSNTASKRNNKELLGKSAFGRRLKKT